MVIMTIKEIISREEKQRDDVMENSDRAYSAFALSRLAMEHDCDSSHAAARLLIAMERGEAFDFRLLLKFDSENRVHADLVIMGYCAHDLWPSRWLDGIGEDGSTIVKQLMDKWLNVEVPEGGW